MFGWRRRSEGFEWREYVRTTVLVRRADRQKRLDDVRLEALAKITDVRDRGVEAGKNGLASVWSSFKDVLQSFLDIALAVLMASAEALWRLLKALGGRAAGMVGAIARRVPRPDIQLPKFKARQPRNSEGLAQRVRAHAEDRQIAGKQGGVRIRLPRLTLPQMPDSGVFSVRALGIAAAAIAAVLGLGPMLGSSIGQPTSVSVAAVESQAVVTSALPDPSKLTGRATAVTGALLRVNGTLVALNGIEAPAPKHPCLKGNGKRWSCATSATNALSRLVRAETITCDLSGRNDAGQPVGSCKAGDRDLGAELVRNGHVFAADGYFNAYAGDEEKAQSEKLGLWQGETVRPKAWRERAWEEAKRTAPDGCPIKGFVRASGRVYSLPWSADYASGKVREVKGERWFCSEDDARAAGFKLSSRS
jgi:endonuclease YncB( thermonuclease family)